MYTYYCYRLAKHSTYSSTKLYSRKERALKIYMDDTPVKSTASTTTSQLDPIDNMEPITGAYSGCTQINDVTHPDID